MYYLNSLFYQAQDLFYDIYYNYSGIAYSARSGLTLFEIEEILYLLFAIRFTKDVLTKNIKTASFILFICFCTTYLWNKDLEQTMRILVDNWEFAPYFEDLRWGSLDLQSNLKSRELWLLDRNENRMLHTGSPWLIFAHTIHAMFNRLDAVYYRVDPFSMWVAEQRLPRDSMLVFNYYMWYNVYIPGVWNSIEEVWMNIRGFCQFTYLTRVGKQYIPYFFRWHFTFQMIYENIELIFLKMAVRAIWYWQEGCWNRLAQISYFEQLDRFLENGNGLYDVDDFDEPEITEKGRWVEPIRHLFKRPFEVDFNIWDWGYCAYEEDKLIFYCKCLVILNQVIIYTHMFILLMSMFSAALGQYMYCPFIVENVERHMEERPKADTYATGYTAWQEIPLSVRATRFPPQLWWGWFSRGTDQEIIFLYIPKQIIKFMLRKLRRFLKKLKRKI